MPFFFPPLARQRLYTSILGHGISLAETLTGRLSQGMENEKLEQEVCRLTGASHALCMPQARVEIYFAVRTLIKPGQTVILSPYTISDVINMVICAGGVPVFADIDSKTCNIDPEKIEELIDDDTMSTSPGASYHTGGGFPMRATPKKNTDTDTLGRPRGYQNVYLVDSTTFPSVPGTTIGLSIMANAYRIGTLADVSEGP